MERKLDFTLTQLEYALAVQRHGHFAKAAEACHVTQPTLSMQVQKLEEILGVTLFDRSKKPILVTEIGAQLLAQFQTVLFEAKKIPSVIESRRDADITGTLVLGIIPTIAPYVLPRMLPVLARMHPTLHLEIQELQTQQIVQALETDEIDAGLLATPLKISAIEEYPLFYEPFWILCGKSHPLAEKKKVNYSELSSQDVWLLTEGHCLRDQVLDVCHLKKRSQSKRNFQFESGSLETLKNLVDSYGGYTLLPELATQSLGKNSVVLPLERPIPAREVGLIYRRKQYKVALIEAVAEAILESLPKNLRALRPKDLEVLHVG